MRRRDFIKAIAVSTWPLAALAQQPRTRVIGVLWPGTTPPASPRMESFRQGLREAGMIEGHDFRIELRYVQDGPQHFPELVAELVRMKVDVFPPAGDFALRIAQQATSMIPIVANSDDMLGMGLVPSLARPGGNTTGDRGARCSSRCSCHLLFKRLSGRRRASELRYQSCRCPPFSRQLHRAHSQVRKAGRSTNPTVGKNRVCNQSQDCQGTRAHRTAWPIERCR